MAPLPSGDLVHAAHADDLNVTTIDQYDNPNTNIINLLRLKHRPMNHKKS